MGTGRHERRVGSPNGNRLPRGEILETQNRVESRSYGGAVLRREDGDGTFSIVSGTVRGDPIGEAEQVDWG